MRRPVERDNIDYASCHAVSFIPRRNIRTVTSITLRQYLWTFTQQGDGIIVLERGEDA